MTDSFLLGVDGGGTQTTALLADTTGVVLGRGSASSSNHHAVGEGAAQDALEAAIGQACAMARVSPERIMAACFGLAGAGRPADRARLRELIRPILRGIEPQVTHDTELALAAGTPVGWGVAVVAGTGSSSFGRGPSGATARAGGWGWLIDDDGGGFKIGLAALRAVVRAADGRGPATTLSAAVLGHWSLATADGLVATVYRTPLPREEIAALAPQVEAAAEAGDPVARELVESAGRELALLAVQVASALGLEGEAPLALTGGVFTRGRAVATAALAALGSARPRFAPVCFVDQPALGALVLAGRERGLELADRLDSSRPVKL